MKRNKTHRYREQIGGYHRGRELREEAKRVKGVNCMVTDGN